jgi:hypothetical protein
MSSMLDQAIIDAAALREAALKNAEQSLIEKYAPQIKEAVETMLESEDHQKMKYENRFVEVIHEADESGMVTVSENGGKPFIVSESELSDISEEELIQEEEMNMATGGEETTGEDVITAPFAGNPSVNDNEPIELNLKFQDLNDDLEIDLGKLEKEIGKELGDAPFPEDDLNSIGDMASDVDAEMDLGALDGEEETEAPTDEPEDKEGALLELLSLLEDHDVLEEEIEIDMSEEKDGTFQTFEPLLDWYNDMEEAKQEHLEEDEDEKKDDSSELQETIDLLMTQNDKLESVVIQLNDKLQETLLSNAKLLYQNRVLADASLNERQKDKIVEAIAKAESPKEARHLCETLRTTVGSSKQDAPKSLNETVNRRSNLSGIINRGQNLNESKSEDSFIKKMQKLAGIK